MATAVAESDSLAGDQIQPESEALHPAVRHRSQPTSLHALADRRCRAHVAAVSLVAVGHVVGITEPAQAVP